MIERRIQSSKLYTAVMARALGGLLKRGAGYPVALRLADAIGHVVGDKENRLFVVLRRSITGRRRSSPSGLTLGAAAGAMRRARKFGQRAIDAVTSTGSSAVRVQLPSFCRSSS